MIRPLFLLIAVLSFFGFLAFSCHATSQQKSEHVISESESNCILKGGF